MKKCGKSILLNQIIDEIKNKSVGDYHIIINNFEFIECVKETTLKKSIKHVNAY